MILKKIGITISAYRALQNYGMKGCWKCFNILPRKGTISEHLQQPFMPEVFGSSIQSYVETFSCPLENCTMAQYFSQPGRNVFTLLCTYFKKDFSAHLYDVPTRKRTTPAMNAAPCRRCCHRRGPRRAADRRLGGRARCPRRRCRPSAGSRSRPRRRPPPLPTTNRPLKLRIVVIITTWPK